MRERGALDAPWGRACAALLRRCASSRAPCRPFVPAGTCEEFAGSPGRFPRQGPWLPVPLPVQSCGETRHLPRTLRFHPPEAVRRDTLRPATGVGRSNAPSRQSRLACSPGPLSAGPDVQQDFVPDARAATPAVALTSWVSDVSWTSLRQRVCIIAQAREGVDWCCRPSYRRGCGKHCGAACWGTAIQQRRRKTLWGWEGFTGVILGPGPRILAGCCR